MPESPPVLFHVCPQDPAHKCWGVYRRRGGAPAPFFLVTMLSEHGKAVEQAGKLKVSHPDADFGVGGAADAGSLPDRRNGF